jgi:hypothetical protein
LRVFLEDLCVALAQQLGVAEITPDMRDTLLTFLAKTDADRKRLSFRGGLECLIVTANEYRERLNGSRMLSAS